MTGIPFPFPYAQLLTMLLIFYSLLTPLFCVVAMESVVLASSFSFISVFAFWGVNFIAAEIESPFGDDENDLPLHALQKDMNKSLWILLHPKTQRVPTFRFDPSRHRKWDVVCKNNFNRESVSRAFFAPGLSRLWTQKSTLESTLYGDIPSMVDQRSMASSTPNSQPSGPRDDAGESELPAPYDFHDMLGPTLTWLQEVEHVPYTGSSAESPNSPTKSTCLRFQDQCLRGATLEDQSELPLGESLLPVVERSLSTGDEHPVAMLPQKVSASNTFQTNTDALVNEWQEDDGSIQRLII